MDVRSAERKAPASRRGPFFSLALPFFRPRAAPPVNATALSDPDTFIFGAAGGHGDDADLYDLLRRSAGETSGFLDKLRDAARPIGAALKERRDADELEIAQWLRILISFMWGAAAIYFLWPHIVAELNDSAVPAGAIQKADAVGLFRIFGVLCLTGIAAAYLPLILGIMNNRFSTSRIGDRARGYGAVLAAILRRLDQRLKDHRERLADLSLPNAAVAAEVSKAHLTAQAAISLFHELPFLVDEESDGRAVPLTISITRFRSYLNSLDGFSESVLDREYFSGLTRGGLAGLIFGVAMGVVGVFAAMGMPIDVSLRELVGELGGIEDYPGALMLILFGALTYFFMIDPLASIFAKLSGGAPREERAAKALSEIRSTITGDQAPRARDIAQRVEDLFEIFRARIDTGGKGPTTLHAAPPDEALPWRRAAEAPRFAAQSFAAAPPVFRADRQAPGEKIISPKRPSNAAPKQSFHAPETPPWLKD